jgi:hypothetical protein
MEDADTENLSDVQAELAAAGLAPEVVAKLCIVESGWYSRLPYLMTPSGAAAIDTWRLLRGVCYGRRYPVLVDGAEDAYGSFGTPRPIADVVADGRRLDTTNQWQKLLAAEMDRWGNANGESPPRSAMTYVHGEWPDSWPARHEFLGPHWGNTVKHPTADILLPVCPEPWMVPAYLYAGPHNDLPDAAVQCAVLRSWYRRFGAEVVYTSGVVYELAVGRPPTNTDMAMELAREHFLFCPDRLNQVNPDYRLSPKAHTLEGYAVMLMASSVWYFWWD